MSRGAGSSTQNESQDVIALRAEVKQFQHELERQREVFHRELMRKAYRIAELEYRVDENALRQKLGYERSLSWRITKPLRIAKRSGKRILRLR